MSVPLRPTGAKTPKQFQEFYGISDRSWRRLKDAGELPRLTRVTPCKEIITSENEKAWLDARTTPAPEVASPFPAEE